MKTIIVLTTMIVLLLSLNLPMASASGSHRANLDRIWKQRQAEQQRINDKMDKIQKDAQRGLWPMSGNPADCARSK